MFLSELLRAIMVNGRTQLEDYTISNLVGAKQLCGKSRAILTRQDGLSSA
jgi:hypothetical protein